MENKSIFSTTRVSAAVSGALLLMAHPVFAQQAANNKAQLDLDEVVVTATATSGSKMKQSISVSTLDGEQILKNQATSGAEVLRSIPGIRSESSGGEGNANITVRGLPISAGGARYVQIQEDGLPILQFGDIAFGTPDSFLRTDNGTDRVEVVRGGSASTLATNSPGGVINFLTKTGDEKGGSIGITKGLDYDLTRYDFDYGSPITKDTRFFIGGYYRSGEGARPAGVTGEEGGQIRGNVTHKLKNGHLRLSFKHLNDQAPTHLPAPVRLNGSSIERIGGIDPRTYTPYGPYWNADTVVDANGNKVNTNVNDGLRVKSSAIGLEGVFDLGNGWKLEERFRKSTNSGRFIGVFPADNGVQGTYTIASGPSKGQVWSGLGVTAAVFNTGIDNLDLTANDLKISKAFDLGATKLTATGGLYTSLQNLGLTWNFNHYLIQGVGEKPALLQTSHASGIPGMVGQYSAFWGGCCQRAIDAEYTTTAPYLALAAEVAGLNVDASVRQDKQKARGTFNSMDQTTQQYRASTTRHIDYDVDHTSFSLGGNYRINNDIAVFARYSDGVAFNADRIMYQPYELNGSTPIPTNTVKQLEGGLKWRAGHFSSFFTLFQAETQESNYEATTQATTNRTYKATGLEIETAYRKGGFRLSAGGTVMLNNEITAAESALVVGKKPRRQSDLSFQIAPSYTFGDASVGAQIIGTTKSYGNDENTIDMKGFSVVNAYVNYNFTDQMVGSLGVNNLFNTLGYTEVEGDGHAARSINGRTVRATLRYYF